MNELTRLVAFYRRRATRTRVRAMDRANPSLLEVAKRYDVNAEQIQALINQGDRVHGEDSVL